MRKAIIALSVITIVSVCFYSTMHSTALGNVRENIIQLTTSELESWIASGGSAQNCDDRLCDADTISCNAFANFCNPDMVGELCGETKYYYPGMGCGTKGTTPCETQRIVCYKDTYCGCEDEDTCSKVGEPLPDYADKCSN